MVFDIKRKEFLKVIGRKEPGERFVNIALYQGKAMRDSGGHVGKGGFTSQRKETDPLVLCSSLKKSRFYIFSKRNPKENAEAKKKLGSLSRDVLNEKPTNIEEQKKKLDIIKVTLPKEAVISTTMGDIRIRLYPIEVPKTVENFVGLVKQGFYDGLLFHRVVNNFMVQTGCPNGDGTGGASIWGDTFEDEFHPSLSHKQGFTVSMANIGRPNTNKSQFFITTMPCEWLDGKHTVFGKVLDGYDVLRAIQVVKVDRFEKPVKDIRIRNIVLIQS